MIILSQTMRLSPVLIAFGPTLENILLPMAYIISPFMSLTIPISLIFGISISIMRLSADGELVALQAAGYSFSRLAAPVLIIASFAYLVSTTSANFLESWGRREFEKFIYRKTQTELDTMLKYQIQPGVFTKNFLDYIFYAESFSKDKTTFKNVMMAPQDINDTSNFILLAPKATIKGSVENANLSIKFHNGSTYTSAWHTEHNSVLKFETAEIDLVRVFQEKIIGNKIDDGDFKNFSPWELFHYVQELKADKRPNLEKLNQAEFLLHSRVATPLCTFAFALFGITFGILNPRRGKNINQLIVLSIVLLAYSTIMIARWLADESWLNSILAAWIPPFSMILISALFYFRRNQVPVWENLLFRKSKKN